MDLRQLSYVVGIVDQGGFTRAAEALHVTQPSLSQAVKALEAELGVELFHRTGRDVVLTAAGEALVGPARQALRDAATARAAVAEVAGLRGGHLDVVCLPTLAVDPVAGLIGRFRREHPGVTVRLAEPDDAATVADQIRSGAAEVGVTELAHAGSPVGLVEHVLGAQDYVAVLPPEAAEGHPPARSVSLAVLARRPLITTPPGTSTRRLLDEALAEAGVEATIAVESDHREVIVPLVAAGAGAALLPRAVATAVAVAGVVVREVRPRVQRRVGLLHRAGPLSPAAAAFVGTTVDGDAVPAAARPRPRPRRRR